MSYTSSERSEQYDSNLKPNMVSYLQENDNKINLQVQKPRDEISKSFSEGKISPVKPLSNTQPDNIPLTTEKRLHELHFITLGNLSEEEKIEIIQRGFQLNQQGKISLKKYYESTDTNSLFQSKGYSIKYQSLRKNDLYKQLKPSNIW